MKKYYIDLIGMSILAGVTIAAILKLPTLPEYIPVHWNINGIIDHQAGKYWIFMGSIASLVVYVLMTGVLNLTLGMTVSKKSSTDNDVSQAVIQRGYLYMGLVKFPLMMIPLLHTASITFLLPNSQPLPIVLVGTIVCIFLALFAIIKLVQNLVEQKGTHVSFQETILNYIGYYDPNDPRVFVDKRIGVGMTVNFATRGGKIFLWVSIIIPFATLIGMAIFVLLK